MNNHSTHGVEVDRDDDETPLQRNLRQARERTSQMPRDKQVIAELWCYATDLRRQCEEHARAKSWYQREKSKHVVEARAGGERSATAAEHSAEAEEDIYKAHLAYRLAEQLIIADRAALNVLHAELDSIRTDRADARKADEFMARTQT